MSKKDKLIAALEDDGSIAVGLNSSIPYYVSTGHYGLNKAISGMWHGGWAGGTVNELFGDPSTGKSIIVTRAMASMQRKEIYIPTDSRGDVDLEDSVVYLDDTEGVYSEPFCQMLGLDPTDVFRYKSTQTVERHFEQTEDKVGKARKIMKKAPIGVFLDSIAQLSTEHEMKTDMSKVDMSKAKQVHSAMRRYSDFIHTNGVLYLIANHVIQNVGVMFGPRTTPKGGGGLAFQTSVRVDLQYKKKFIRNEMETEEAGKRGDVYGVRGIATAVKNKVAAPFAYTVLDIYFDHGLDPYSGLVDYFTRTHQITQVEAAKGGKNPKPARLNFKVSEGQNLEFNDGEFTELVIEYDLLDIKRHGFEYLKPIDKAVLQSQTRAEDFPVPPPPPVTGAPSREAKA